MEKLDLKSLLRRLTPTCRKALEAAVNDTVNRRHYEVTIAHFVLALLADPGSDAWLFVARSKPGLPALVEHLAQVRSDLRDGNPGKPIFSSHLIQLFDDTWHKVSAGLGHSWIRSGVLLLLLSRDTGVYVQDPSRLAPLLRGLEPREPDGEAGAQEKLEAQQQAPTPPRPRLPRTTVIHDVRPGETLLILARRYAIDLEDLAHENNLDIRAPLRQGMTLRLRVLPRDVFSGDQGEN